MRTHGTMITATAVKLDEIHKRIMDLAIENDVVCDHSVGICCGWHWTDFRPNGISKTGLYFMAKELAETMHDTDKANPGNEFPPEVYPAIKAIIKDIRALTKKK